MTPRRRQLALLGGGLAALVVAVVLSGFQIAWARHDARELFVKLQKLRERRDRLEIQWGRLQLEQSTWATHARIEKIAVEQLSMHTPAADETALVAVEVDHGP